MPTQRRKRASRRNPIELRLDAHTKRALKSFDAQLRAAAKLERGQKHGDALRQLAREMGIMATRSSVPVGQFSAAMRAFQQWHGGRIPDPATFGESNVRGNPRGLTKAQALDMLRRGEFSSARQRRFLGARASGAPVKKAARRNPSRDSYGVYEIADRGRAIGFAAAESAAGARRFLEEMGGVRNVDRLQVRELVRGLTLNKALGLARHLQRGGSHAK